MNSDPPTPPQLKPLPWDLSQADYNLKGCDPNSGFKETVLPQRSPILGTNDWHLVKLMRMAFEVTKKLSNSFAVAWFLIHRGANKRKSQCLYYGKPSTGCGRVGWKVRGNPNPVLGLSSGLTPQRKVSNFYSLSSLPQYCG